MLNNKIRLLFLCMITAVSYANAQQEEPDLYSQCVDETIQTQQLASINNAVVEVCSQQAKAAYETQIVKLLDKIKEQGSSERYQDIMKSQRLWKQYVDQECKNAGDYIGSPMYGYCPMQQYQQRLDNLKHFVD
ncbi:lysozyme inhibitor LprI family protein [Acinetobacter ihumii]|uniref:lysozyme inhibitor LprI family protein n=1 Tax=Acinetobacter ihumii TaxID=2483802 RepID=UPI001031E775|nr:lysozyme inhibitor LprI family protein [Acinetobacter ihumii]